jgi:uncharacterized membrane protein YhaH (DUF805 family)
MLNRISDSLLNLFRGRLGAGYFLLGWLLLIPLALSLLFFQLIFVNLSPVFSFFIPFIFLASLEIRRLHDVGKSGGWLCITLLLGPASLLLALIPGRRGTNKYGGEPPAKVGLISAILNLDKSNYTNTPQKNEQAARRNKKIGIWILTGGVLVAILILGIRYFINKQDALNEWRSHYRYLICKQDNCIYANKYGVGQYGCVYAEEVMGGGLVNKLCGEYQINNNPLYYDGNAD